ncbi:hypothetical protein HHI36_005632 [Cryptolaemus montrouzieri]|uniref:Uncharacterized protein n=1 Tax=Cryptolaemus montrouzieri TaxID=559131 RepID=A0ABD2NVP6_9CUCU
MGDHNYFTALSHAILAGTSIYCLMEHTTDMGIICYGLIATNSILGLWRWGNPDAESMSKSMYDTTSIAQEMLSIGAVAAEIWTTSTILPEFWWAEIALPIVPLSMYFLEKDFRDIENGIMAINGISIVFVSIMTSNWWGVAAAASYLWGYLYVKDRGSIRDIPAIDLINYELCFFSYFALRALCSN